jgi:hypothetical protein
VGVRRDVALALGGGAIFAAALVAYLLKETAVPEGPKLVETTDAARGPDALELAQRTAEPFVAALRLGDYAGAYAQMARPYREASTVEAFTAAWKVPLLAAPRGVKLTHATSSAAQNPDGTFVTTATFTARGMLLAAAGPLEVSVTFLRDGSSARVLAVFVGGAPVVH